MTSTVCNNLPELSLQIGAAVKYNTNNLQTLDEAGGFRRITQLMQWTAFTFHPAGASGSSSSHTGAAQHSPQAHSHATAGSSSPKGGLKSLTIRSRHGHPGELAQLLRARFIAQSRASTGTYLTVLQSLSWRHDCCETLLYMTLHQAFKAL